MSQATTNPTKSAGTIGDIQSFLKKVGASQAADDTNKEAEALNEHGGYEGSTTHPVKDVDDGTQEATTGARASENEKDNREEQGSAGVDSTPEASPGQQDGYQLNINMTESATGEDASTEDDFKGDKDDPGTTAKATTEDGEKYGEDTSMADLLKASAAMGDQLCTLLTKKATGEQTEAPAAGQPQEKLSDAEVAAKAGWELAGIANGELNKESVDTAVVNDLAQVITTAEDAAQKTAALVQSYTQERAKQAASKSSNDEEGGDDDEESDGGGGEGDKTEGMGEDEAMMGPGMGEGGEEMPGGPEMGGEMGGLEMGGPEMGGEMGGGADDILAALAGGEDMGAEDAMAGMTGEEGYEEGGPEMGGEMGGPEMGGGEMGGGGEEEMLLAALEQAGISPEELMVAAEAREKTASHLATAAKGLKRASANGRRKYEPKTAKEKKRFDAMTSYIGELVPTR
jgi:hypothetical protein